MTEQNDKTKDSYPGIIFHCHPIYRLVNLMVFFFVTPLTSGKVHSLTFG
jgi:hypothetical protein